MKKIQPFDPSIGLSGVIQTNGINPGEQIVLYNDSLIGLDLQFPNGNEDILAASWVKDWIVPDIPLNQIEWSQYYQLNFTNYPISKVYGAIYEPGEHVPSVNAPIPRAFSLANQGGVPTAITNLTNDGNNAGTQFIEATQAGNTVGSNIYAHVDGTVSIAELIAGVLYNLIKTIPGASGSSLQLSAFNRTCEILGQLQIDQHTVCNDKLYSNVQTSFNPGSLTGWSKVTGTVNNSGGLFNHGLGTVPDIVLITETDSSSDSNTIVWDNVNSTSTQIKLYSSGATARAFQALCIKF